MENKKSIKNNRSYFTCNLEDHSNYETNDIKTIEVQLGYLKGQLKAAIDRPKEEDDLAIELTKEVNKVENILIEKKRKAWQNDLAAFEEMQKNGDNDVGESSNKKS